MLSHFVWILLLFQQLEFFNKPSSDRIGYNGQTFFAIIYAEAAEFLRFSLRYCCFVSIFFSDFVLLVCVFGVLAVCMLSLFFLVIALLQYLHF